MKLTYTQTHRPIPNNQSLANILYFIWYDMMFIPINLNHNVFHTLDYFFFYKIETFYLP